MYGVEVDMKGSVYIYQNGILSRNDNTLRFTNEEGDKRDIPIENVSEIYFLGEDTLNTKAINFLSTNQVVVHFFNYYGFYSASIVPRKRKSSGSLLVNQVNNYVSMDKRLNLAKKIVRGSAETIYRNLRYYNSRGRDLNEEMSMIKVLINSISYVETIEELMGFEGNIHKIYYQTWNKIINQEIDFEKRVKRPPDNMINTMISYINSLVYTTVLAEIYKTQLDPTISYLHEPGTGRFSLSLDLAEIFKPLIADRLIFSLLNRNQIQEKHFNQDLNWIHLTEDGSKIILAEYDKFLKRTIKHKDLGREVSYRYLIRLECYKLIKHLIGEKDYEPFVIWW